MSYSWAERCWAPELIRGYQPPLRVVAADSTYLGTVTSCCCSCKDCCRGTHHIPENNLMTSRRVILELARRSARSQLLFAPFGCMLTSWFEPPCTRNFGSLQRTCIEPLRQFAGDLLKIVHESIGSVTGLVDANIIFRKAYVMRSRLDISGFLLRPIACWFFGMPPCQARGCMPKTSFT